MLTHQRLPDCRQTVQEVLGHLSEYQLCMQCHPTHHHSHQRTSQRLLRNGDRHHLHTQQFVDPCHSMKLHFQCEPQHRRVQTGQNYQLLLQQLQIAWPSHLLLPVQHHTTVQKASTRCENFQLLPMLSPSAPVVPLVANTDANSPEVRPDIFSHQNTSNVCVQKILVDFGI